LRYLARSQFIALAAAAGLPFPFASLLAKDEKTDDCNNSLDRRSFAAYWPHAHQVSAFDELARILKTEAVDFLQIPYSIAETTAEERLLRVAHERRVAVIANQPFAQGRLFRRVKDRAVPAWAVQNGITSWAQYFLKFILSEPRIQFVIPATRRLEHLRENMAAGLGLLPDEKMRARMRREFLETP
jgi:aryl-alcohol dehydrogenase-like predicted oxidoreductase